jgi:hypothetical protein
MKTKLEMAHEWYLKHSESPSFMNTEVEMAWDYADAMQAEADKRNPKEPRETHKNLAEFKMYPEYDASINYPPDAWVMYKGEKRLAVSIDTEKEWQPDWSQAPNGYDWFVVERRSGKGFFCLVEPAIVKDHYWFVGEDCLSVDKHNYQGDWRNSLRKRPK